MIEKGAHRLGGPVRTGHAEGQKIARDESRKGDGAQAIEARTKGPGQHGRLPSAPASLGIRADLAHRKGLPGQQRPEQVVDTTFENGEPCSTADLRPHHPGEVGPAASDQKAPRLEDQLPLEPRLLRQEVRQPAAECADVERLLGRVVGHTEPSTQVDLVEDQAVFREPAGD